MISDAHIGGDQQDDRALRIFHELCKDIDPDHLIFLGDILDLLSCSQHPASEASRTMLVDELRAGRDFVKKTRKLLPKATMAWTEGNHETRFTRKVLAKMPEFFGVTSVPKELGLRELGVSWHPYGKLYRPRLRSGKRSRLAYVHGKYTNKYHAEKHRRQYAESVRYGHVHGHQIIGSCEGERRKLVVGVGTPTSGRPSVDYIVGPTGHVQGFGLDEIAPSGSFQTVNLTLDKTGLGWGGKNYA